MSERAQRGKWRPSTSYTSSRLSANPSTSVLGADGSNASAWIGCGNVGSVQWCWTASRLKTCVRRRASQVASHWPSGLTAMRVTVVWTSFDSSSSASLSSDEDSAPSWDTGAPPSFSDAISTSRSAAFVEAKFLRPATTRPFTKPFRSRCCSNLRKTRGERSAVPRSTMSTAADSDAARMSLEESGVKVREDAPVEVLPS